MDRCSITEDLAGIKRVAIRQAQPPVNAIPDVHFVVWTEQNGRNEKSLDSNFKAAVYENAWIRVDHHEVLRPDGGPGIYGTVHFKLLATGVVPIDKDGNVILVGQYRFPLGAYSWEIPEGGGSRDVPALESAQRELREECGLVAKCWMEILGMDLSNSVSDEGGTMFLAWNLSEAPSQPDETEELQVARVPFWDAVAARQAQRNPRLDERCGAASRGSDESAGRTAPGNRKRNWCIEILLDACESAVAGSSSYRYIVSRLLKKERDFVTPSARAEARQKISLLTNPKKREIPRRFAPRFTTNVPRERNDTPGESFSKLLDTVCPLAEDALGLQVRFLLPSSSQWADFLLRAARSNREEPLPEVARIHPRRRTHGKEILIVIKEKFFRLTAIAQRSADPFFERFCNHGSPQFFLGRSLVPLTKKHAVKHG